MQLLGYDIGSSSIKASVIDVDTGRELAFAQSPAKEMAINAPKTAWAEQDPHNWWKHLRLATEKLLNCSRVSKEAINAIGISYQMHGLVLVDAKHNVLRPSIIWCDGRAVEIGRKAFRELGAEFCLTHYLNSPGNFTASKLKWVKDNEPDIYGKIHKFMLPGDYIGMKLTGEICTTYSGLSEGILWDYKQSRIATALLDYYGIDKSLVPQALKNFDDHGRLTRASADELGLKKGTKVTYRAGDQPNNALSLNVMEPGEIASTAGTSGVIYGVTDKRVYDKYSRVNTFVHVNNEENKPRNGVLLCVNGTGIQNSWLKGKIFADLNSYDEMNELAQQAPVGCDGLSVFPFGNGPERVLKDKHLYGHIKGINFNRHDKKHLVRAAHEGIAFSMNYGLQIMEDMGVEIKKIRAASSNMFLSPVFREALCNTSGVSIELYHTSGARGAAIGAGIAVGHFSSREDAFESINQVDLIESDPKLKKAYLEAYNRWKTDLEAMI